jgi:hypothetical protein
MKRSIVGILILAAVAFATWGVAGRLDSDAANPVLSTGPTPAASSSLPGGLKTVFVIVMENHNWASIKGSPDAPYINHTLLRVGAHTEQYYNPPSVHPSEPNYIWLEAGSNLGIGDDSDPGSNHQSTKKHLVTLLKQAGISWKAYAEGIGGASCPLTSTGNYAPKHVPFLYFDDVTGVNDPTSPYCIQHVRPYSELTGDLRSNAVPRYVFITPDLCDDMHNACAPLNNPVQQGDTWLSQQLPQIFHSAAYQHGGVVFITWDEGEGGSDGPIGLIALSSHARRGYTGTEHYTHSSLLRTVQEILGVTPLLGDAAHAADLGALFSPAPILPRVKAFSAARRGSIIRFQWRLTRRGDALSFAVYAGKHRLNRTPIPFHTAPQYQYQTHWAGPGPFRLASILTSGREITVARG